MSHTFLGYTQAVCSLEMAVKLVDLKVSYYAGPKATMMVGNLLYKSSNTLKCIS